MGRAKGSLITALAALPWPAGVVIGSGGFVAIRYGLPGFLKGDPFAPALTPVADLMSWLFLIAGLIRATMSWLGQRQRRRLLDAWKVDGRMHQSQDVEFWGCSVLPVCRGVS